MNIIHYKTRTELLKLVPPDSKFVEIGVFKGDFSNEIIEISNPKELYLVDIWEGKYGSGDKDGNNHIEIEDMEKVYLKIFQQTKHVDSIHVIRSKSISFLQSCEDNYFDVIYVDGDHTSQAVYEDMVNSFSKLRNGGLLMGHDYHYKIGGEVVYAVSQFCSNYKQEVSAISDDGCPSFLIKIIK